MSWLQLRIHAKRDQVPDIEQALEACSSLSITLEDNADQPIFEPGLGETPLWNETRVTGLFTADVNSRSIEQSICRKLNLSEKQLHWHVLEDKDWEREWMSSYAPIQCADKLWICPSWIAPPDPDAVNLLLDPGLAFGTGTHPTTFLCLNWMAEQSFDQLDVLDYGCGSGILGIVALLLGANQATGVDIDPQALLATQNNAQRNQLSKQQFPVFYPEKTPQKKYAVVLANILAGPLVELAEKLLSHLKPGGLICLSGLLDSQEHAIVQAYKHKIEFAPAKRKDGWICLTGKYRVGDQAP